MTAVRTSAVTGQHSKPTHTRQGAIARGARNRIAWIDIARGLGIILVVIGHAAGGLIDGPKGHDLSALRYGFIAIYTFHMPVFFLLSGLMVQQRLARGIDDFLGKLLVGIVYPYFLWSIIQFSTIFALGSLVNHPVDSYWPTILALPWQTVSQFWFLHALFLNHLLAITCWRAGGRFGLLLAMACLLKLSTFMPIPMPVALALAAGNAPYYAIGMILGPQGLTAIVTALRPWLRLAVLIAAIATIWFLCLQGDAIQDRVKVASASSAGLARIGWDAAMLPAAILGSGAFLIVAWMLAHARVSVAAALAWLGRASMPIFLLHILFMAGTRIAAARLCHLSGIELLPILAGMGLIGPIIVKMLADRWKFSRILGFG